MRLKIPADQLSLLRHALARAGTNEIGGQLFGEQLAPSDFSATDIVIQKRPGTFARFIVDLVQAARDALSFFERTEHRYARFNYIGEWHSHPSFALAPSTVDLASMVSLVCDKEFRGTFAVLLIVQLDANARVQGKAWVFDRRGTARLAILEFDKR